MSETATVRWAYHSGKLEAEAGTFGISIAIFEVAPEWSPWAYVGVTDLVKNQFYQWSGPYRFDTEPGHFDFTTPWGEISLMFAGAQWQSHGRLVKPRGGWSEYSSATNETVAGALTLGQDTFAVTGLAWGDFEYGYLPVGIGWKWFSLRFDNGHRALVYAFDEDGEYRWQLGGDNDKPIITALATWESPETKLVYETQWQFGKYTLAAALPDQEILDTKSNLCYWEGLCWIKEGETVVGHAYVEQVHAGWGGETELQRLTKWTLGNTDAMDLMGIIGRASQIADAFVDEDYEVTGPDRSSKMVELLMYLAVYLPKNPFYQKHSAVLEPVLVSCLQSWDLSNYWAKSPHRETRMFGFAYREALEQFIGMVAILVGGPEHGRKVRIEAQAGYHNRRGLTFEAWEKEESHGRVR